jgi:uncharacterized membrane protein YccF (DUF307 family)
MIVVSPSGHGFLVRALWYIFVGWWLTGIALTVGYVLTLTIVGIPFGFWIFNRTGTLLTLRPRSQPVQLAADGSVGEHPNQRSLLLRAIWFVLVGWWLAGLWMGLAYLVSLTIIGIPLGIWMLNRLPEIFTLHRN